MKKIIIILLTGVLVFAFAACTREANEKEAANLAYNKISAKEAKTMMEKSEDMVILDIRTQEEYDKGHVPGAILILEEQLREKAETIIPNKDETILIYSKDGSGSREATNTLLEMGYTNVYDFGGTNAYPYELVRD